MATSIALALIHSRLDYASWLLCGIFATNIHKLQRCQNAAAHLILQQSRTPSVQHLVDQLHWQVVSTHQSVMHWYCPGLFLGRI